MEENVGCVFLLLLLMTLCNASPLEFLKNTNSSDPSSRNIIINQESAEIGYPVVTDIDLRYTEAHNIDTGTRATNTDNDYEDSEFFTDDNGGALDSSIIGPDFKETDTPILMETLLNPFQKDESEGLVDTEINAKIIDFLQKPNRKESDILNLLVNILQSYTNKGSEEPNYAEINAKIIQFLQNPNQKELDILNLFRNALKSKKYQDSEDSNAPVATANPLNLIRDLVAKVDAIMNSTATPIKVNTDRLFTNSDDIAKAGINLHVKITESTEPGDQDYSEDQLDIPEDIANSLDFLIDPTVPKALDATKKLNVLESQQRKNTTVERTDGFDFLNMASQFQRTKGLKKKYLVKRVKKDLEQFKGKNEQLTDIVETLLEYIGNETKKHTELLFSIISDVGNGHVKALFVSYKQREDGKYNLKKLKFNGKINLAATLVITRISKSNSTDSESKDVISYLPRDDATEKDVTELLNIMVPELGKLLGDLSFEDDKPKTFMSKLYV